MRTPVLVAKFSMVPSLAVAVCLGAAWGCGSAGDEGFPVTFPVQGKVTLKGQPLPKGSISFIPSEGRPSTAIIQPDGSYVLSTFKEKDGAVPGRYRVTVTATDADPMQMPRPGGPAPKSLVPKKYNRPETSRLEAVVDKKSNEFPFDLQ